MCDSEKRPPMISIIIPVFNEEKAIAETLHKCREVLDSIDNINSEIIVIDDASIDNTIKNVQQFGIKLITHSHNLGYGKSLKDGIMASSYDTIFIADADGTYPLEMIPGLLNTFNKGYHMVVGARQWSVYKESLIKRISRKILHQLIMFSTGEKVPDVNSGLRVFSKKEILPFLPDLCDRFSFTTSLTLSFLMNQKSVEYIPIEYHKRIGKSKVKPIADSIITLQFIFKALNKFNPIKLLQLYFIFMIFIGIIGSCISFIWLSNIVFWAASCCALFSLLALLFIIFLPVRKSKK
jgi:polyisoprenyl-phosphate glycosyltransferase